jgi:hypothetical protein
VNDHQVINALADVILGVLADANHQNAALRSLTHSGLELRQQVSAVRAELTSGLSGANDAAQSAAMAQMAVDVEAKFAQMDMATAELLAGIQALGVREQLVEQVMEKQVAGNEAIVNDAFMQMDAKISRVVHWQGVSVAGRSLSTRTTFCRSPQP